MFSDTVKAYSRLKHYSALTGIIISLAYFLLLLVSEYSITLERLASGISPNRYIAMLIYISILGAGLALVSLPLDFLSSFKIEHAFGLSRQRLGAWIKDYIKKLLVSAMISSIMIVVLYYFLINAPRLWWLYTAFIYFIVSVILAKLLPILIIPLFYKLEKLQDIDLRERLMRLAHKARANVLDIYKIGLGAKTVKANAAVCGMGSTKRILLSDTLIEKYSPEEIEATLAHELAHYKHRHIWKLNLYSLFSTIVGFAIINLILQRLLWAGYMDSLYQLRVLCLLALLYTIYNIIVTPVTNLVSRRYETEADMTAVALTNKPASLQSLLSKLTLQNLSDPSPGALVKAFFYDHPPTHERIVTISKAQKKNA